jgi:multiple sugar transport system substrate-binding protein
MKKSLSAICLLILITLVVSACTPKGGTPTTSSKTPSAARKTATPTKTSTQTSIGIQPEALKGIHLQVAYAYTGPFETQFSDLMAEFNTVNPWGIVVYTQAGDSYNSLYETVSASIGKTDQPDLVITLPEQIMDWDSSNAVIDLTSYLEDAQYGLSGTDKADFEPIFWAQTWQNDEQLGLPAAISSQFLYYNLTWAKELGFTHPPLTSAEFRQQACAANQSFRTDADLQNDGYGGWIVDTNPQAVLAWMQAFGGEVVTDGKYTFANKANQTTLEFLKKLYDDNCAYISTELSPYGAFANRFAIFITADMAEIPLQNLAFEQAGNSDQWTVIPFPGIKSQLIAEGPYYSVLKSTPEKQLAAWLFVRWLLSTENQVSWVQGTGLFPLRISAYGPLTSYASSHKQWQAATGYMEDLVLQPSLASWRKARLVLGDGTEFIFRTNVKLDQIPAVLKQMDTTVQDLITVKP